MANTVDIGKKVDYKTLETALVKAAKEVGWKARVQDIFERNYKLGSVRETQDYSHTVVHLRGRIFPIMRIFVSNKNSSDHFDIWPEFSILRGYSSGAAFEKGVKRYLSAVSRNL